MTDMRTPLGKVRGLGSAKDGTEHFWRQRVTAVANVPLTIFFIGLIIALNGASYDEVQAALSNPFVALLTMGAILSALYHMKLGMQVIIEDYIHDDAWKFLLVMLNTFFVASVGLLSVFALLKLAFAG
ncbi:succinate dehydrogenase, hydrophobic membrane anchor protein [Zhengella mangrovi]|uniref:Succinate dehydrogenase hydrophobic membrane anchor subunit n=1 Tax=Zhengella mangrovi TaxID=1982044 RepID=A0A2G1QSK5_9HYPH|nr:succinate dehydrogenase, hydrophobic membrane anchor protein [Zhengella mangrovi]PHP68526.1 succinate dehydrogenase, hydrophobic membrane anchor protein [Zhengella mangrovi]